MMSDKNETATLGGGCFWCLEAVFNDLEGVLSAISGYTGGHVANPDYQMVCDGNTGHAEVVQVTYDPEIITYEEILEVFFSIHDPTTLNRQGIDEGAQYRSVIFYHNNEQKALAQKSIHELTKQEIWSNPIVTEITKLTKFYPAEDYHQEYFKRNPFQGYCMTVVSPKVAEFRKKFADRLKNKL